MPGKRIDPATYRPCGTTAAAKRHYRRGEPLDEACMQAVRLAAARDKNAAGTLSPDSREVRNGLPEFRPYIYRGLGFDIYQPGGRP